MKYLRILTFIYTLAILTGCKETVPERCAREAEEANKLCPKIMNENTLLDSVKYVKDSNSFIYFYTLKDNETDELSKIIKNKESKNKLLQELANDADMRFYLKQEITFEYIYFSKKGYRLGNIIIAPDDYDIN